MPSLADRYASAEYSCTTCSGPTYSQGLDTYVVPMALHELNRARLTASMLTDLASTSPTNDIEQDPENQKQHHKEQQQYPKGLILLQGGSQTTRYDTDHEPLFRQESYFHWAFGVTDSDCYGAISLPSGKATLFLPTYGIDYRIFCGESDSLNVVRERYGVERVLPVEELASFVKEELGVGDDDDGTNPSRLHLLSGINTDSGNTAMPASYDGMNDLFTEVDSTSSTTTTTTKNDRIDYDTLFRNIARARVTKTKAEVEVMRYTHWVSSMAHVEVMKGCRVGMMEYQLESLFQHHTYTHGGCRHMSYTCICACGPNPAVLHYGHAGRPNNRQLCDGDMALLDMGAEYHCYASDITCSFPVNGVFTPNQRLVFEAVLSAQTTVIAALRPGVSWLDMHRLAERAILRNLVSGGLLHGNVDEMIDADLGAIFMPHGLGHLIGLDTHDVGGYAEGTPPRSTRPGLSKLRTARVMEEGMVVTVEPGCYFIDVLLDMALANPQQSKFIVKKRLEEFRGTGGVRLEDGVLITEDACENLTMCPRTVEEVEGVMGGGVWPPDVDTMPELRRNWVTREGGRMVPLEIPLAK